VTQEAFWRSLRHAHQLSPIATSTAQRHKAALL
jgi:hypothetical protein